MNPVIQNIFSQIESSEKEKFDRALSDLRLIIERFTQGRYSDEEIENYLILFYDKRLINLHLVGLDLEVIKYFLFFILLNFPDRATPTAKCIKVLFDKSIREAICTAIEIYMEKDDHTTCELMFAITNVGDMQDYFSSQRILDLFKKIALVGGKNSKEVAIGQLDYFKKYF